MVRILVALAISVSIGATVFAGDVLKPISQRLPSEVSDTQISFQRHVVPLLGRTGCNGRACHGSFQGQAGFRLSLFGYDFAADHEALVGIKAKPVTYKNGKPIKKKPVKKRKKKSSPIDNSYPRVNLTNSRDSLILKKPISADDHEGGARLKVDSWQYRLLQRWIEDGAIDDTDTHARMERLEVLPRELFFQTPGDSIELRAIAHWSDGMKEDVTELCRFQSDDPSVAKVDETGKVTSLRKGDTHIATFYDNGIATTQSILPLSDQNGDNYPDVPQPTQIDQLIVAKLRSLGILPSELCTDSEFLRRVSLDITGTLPAPAEVLTFSRDTVANKRERKIDELLERPTYAAWWATKLCDFSGNSGNFQDPEFAREYARQWYEWIFRRIQQNEGYDKVVRGILLATGRSQGQDFAGYNAQMSSYLKSDSDADFATRDTMPHFWARANISLPKEKALAFSYSFLGVRLQCAECHKHPFDQWTKQDFAQLSAFFEPVGFGTPGPDRERMEEMIKAINPDYGTGKGKKGGFPYRTDLVQEGKVVPFREVYVAVSDDDRRYLYGRISKKNRKPSGLTAKLLGDAEVDVKKFSDPREPLMDWMLDKDNPFFTRAFVNRVWASYFNVGIIDPPDDLNLANPPSNQPLLDYLTTEFRQRGYDMKWLHREITRSRTYQLSTRANGTNRQDTRHFSRAVPRRLPAEVAYDAIQQATSRKTDIDKLQTAVDGRVIGGNDIAQYRKYRRINENYGLAVLGKPSRTENCDCDRSNEPNLLMTLYLLNDGEMLNTINRSDGWISEISNRLGQSVRTFAAQIKTKKGKVKSPVKQDRASTQKAIVKLETKIKLLEKKGQSEQAATLRRVVAVLKAKTGIATSAGPTESDPPQSKPNPGAKPETPDDLIAQAYLRTVSRQPTSDEVARARQYIAESRNTAEGVRDLLWALLNSNEFLVNH